MPPSVVDPPTRPVPVLLLSGHRGLVRRVKFSPTEPVIASVAGSERGVSLRSLTGPKKAKVLPAGSEMVTDFAFSPDGRFLVMTDRHADLYCHDLHGDTVRLKWKNREQAIGELISPRLAVLPLPPDTSNGSKVLPTTEPAPFLVLVGYSTSLRRLHGIDFFTRVGRVEFPRMIVREPLMGTGMGGEILISDPERSRIFLGEEWKTIAVWNDTDGTLLNRLPQRGNILEADLSDDGSQLAVISTEEFRLWELCERPLADVEPTPDAHLTAATFAPGERFCLCASREGEVIAYRTENHRLARTDRWQWDIGQLQSVAVSPDTAFYAAGGNGWIVVWDAE